MPLSSDPAKKARQLANLKPGAGAWKPGDSPALVHGARSRQPQRSPAWSPAVTLSIDDLEQRVGAELRDEGGALQAWAVPSVEAVALQRVAAQRADRFIADREERGVLRPRDLEVQSLVTERYHRALEREALTLRSRIETREQAATLADLLAAQGSTDG